jgi:hypothetical protein
MPWIVFLIFLLASVVTIPVRAVMMNDGYDSTPPTSSNIPNWDTGWGNASVTGWDYVGYVDGTYNGTSIVGSGVYLGNGWVLTAAHIGVGNFYLSGTYYYPVVGSVQSFTVSGKPNEPVDLCLFQISAPPNLPALTISQSLPNTGSPVAMLGTGGNSGLTWGYDNVTATNVRPDPPVVINNTTYYSTNFVADMTGSNTSILVTGDSGGGDFVYNTSTQKWELTGINEFSGTYSDGTQTSGFVQLNQYESTITYDMAHPNVPVDTPTMPFAGLMTMACVLFLAAARSLEMRKA